MERNPPEKRAVRRGWSFRIGRIFGVDTYVHGTFLLFLAFMAVLYWSVYQSLAGALEGVLFLLAVFGCVMLHEFGHVLAARKVGVGTRSVTLLPLGGIARLERMPRRPAHELWIAIAGPLVNVGIAAVLFLALIVTGAWQPPGEVGVTRGHFVERLLFANVVLVAFNLVPAFPMDGGRVLRAVLAMSMGHTRATAIAAFLGKGFALLFGFLGLFSNPMLILIAVFVWAGADAEARSAGLRDLLGGMTVRDAMVTQFRAVGPEDALDSVVRQILAGTQEDFPVVSGGALLGVLRRTDLIAALATRDRGARVDEVMARDVPAVHPDVPLQRVLETRDLNALGTIPVAEDGRILGLLTAQNVLELVMIRSALQRHGGAPEVPPPLPDE